MLSSGRNSPCVLLPFAADEPPMGGRQSALSPSRGLPHPLGQYACDLTRLRGYVQGCAGLCRIPFTNVERGWPGSRAADATIRGKRLQNSCRAQVPRHRWRSMHHHEPGNTKNSRRAQAGVHELAGSELPGRLPGDRPPLDRCGAHCVLPHARRPTPLLARSARPLRHVDAARGPYRGSARGRPEQPRGLERPPFSWRACRTSRAGACRRRSPAAARACRVRARSVR